MDDGTITINATGNNLKYSINDGISYQSSNIFSNLVEGTYSVKVIDRETRCIDDYVNNPIDLTNPNCVPEICGNGIDDDGDGLIDDFDPDCIETCNVLFNGEFNDGVNNWTTKKEPGTKSNSDISISEVDVLSGANTAYVDISEASGTDWHLELIQPNVELISGETYKLSIKAKAEANRPVTLVLQLREAPWTPYWSKEINLTTTAQVFEFDNIATNR